MTVDIASVSVEEKPRVRIVVEPELPLSESRNGNVTLKCRLEDQPSEKYATQFASVKWYLDGELLKHVEKHPGTHSFQFSDGERKKLNFYFQMVNISLRVLSRPDALFIPVIARELGQDFDEKGTIVCCRKLHKCHCKRIGARF